MSAPKLKARASDPPYQTKRTLETDGDVPRLVVVYEAQPSDFEGFKPNISDWRIDSTRQESIDGGLARLTVVCSPEEEDDASAQALTTTFRVEMQEVEYDLEDHPYLEGARDVILKWLATDESQRVEGALYYWVDAEGNRRRIDNDLARKFIAAYMAGLRTFLRFYPVVSKISVWKKPPGLNRATGKTNSYTGGSVAFSSGIGRYDSSMPLYLSGFGAANWFKSRDSWVENEDKTWTRTEQWTFTPASSASTHAWIYNNL